MWPSTMTRSDISNAVRAVACHSSTPTGRHWESVLKIMAYLQETRGTGLTFVRGLRLDLTARSDADYADNSNDRRSISETVVTLAGASVSWASSTQRGVTLSTTEAEYVAPGEGVKEALFTGAVLSFICPELSGSCIRVFHVKQAAIASGGWIRRQCRREIERRRAGQRRVELTLRENSIFQTSPENCEEHFVFWNGEGELTGRSGNQSTFEGAVTEWAKTLRLSRTAAAGRHTKARDQRAHHHESSRHRIFFWIFDEAVPF